MADSIREQIRDNVMSALALISTSSGYANSVTVDHARQWNNEVKDRHIIVNVTGQEPSDSSAIGTQRWLLNFEIEAIAVESETSTTPIFDRLNSLASDVEKSLMADPHRNNLADDTYIRGLDFNVYADGAAVIVNASVQYWHDYEDPTSKT